jgi:hypothetical protein
MKAKIFRLSLIAAMLLSASKASIAGQAEFYLSSHIFGHSETAPIKQIVVDDFEGSDFDAGKHSFTHNVWEAGAVYKGIKLAVIARYDYALSYSEDTAYLVYADKNEVQIQKNKRYELDLDVFHARTNGVKIGYQLDLNNDMRWEFDVSYLTVSTFLDGGIDGAITVLDDDYQGEINLDYVYDNDKLLDRQVEKTSGKGFAADLSWAWQANSKLGFAAKWIDLYSALRIERAPFTEAKASSSRVNLDAQGRIDVKPVLSGRERYRKHTLRFPRQMKLEGNYWLEDRQQLALRYYRYDRLGFVSVSLLQKLSQAWSVDGAYDFSAQALTFGLTHLNFRLELSSDHLDLYEARTFGLISEFRMHF